MKSTERIYLDYAASTPLDDQVAAAMAVARSVYANPSAPYVEGRAALGAYRDAKKQLGGVLGVRSDELILTSGATESDNLAILGTVRPQFEQSALRPGIVTIATEHKSVLAPIKQLEREGAAVAMADVDSGGVVSLRDLEDKIGDSTVLVSIALASSEIGTIQPMRKVGQLVAKIKKSRGERGITTPLLLHSDGSAAAGLLPLSPTRLSLDLLTLNASKFYGPHGCGLLYVRPGGAISPIMYGGSQQGGLRPGSEDVAGAVGLSTALCKAEAMRHKEVVRLAGLRDSIMQGLLTISPNAIVNGPIRDRLANNIHLSFPGLNGEDIVAHFDVVGVSVATGAACAAADEAPSPAVMALGRSRAEAQGSLRITLGRSTNEAQVVEFLARAKQVLTKLARI